MPSFYPSGLPRQLPPTPPDYYNPHQNIAAGGMQSSAPPFYGQMGGDARYGMDGRDKFGYLKQPGYPTVVPASHTAFAKELDAQGAASFAAPFTQHETNYGHAAPSVLPPIRIRDRAPEQAYQPNHIQHLKVQTQPKEEKVAGGVAAHLDYDMESMVDFVSEMAQGIVQPSASVTADFRKYVSQILTSTRLPSSTIFLGLHYLGTRMTMLSSDRASRSSSGQVYRMLTTALMLGSKFLDDNTFQNRSWAEVSHIPVQQLDDLELKWLIDIEWNLHIDPANPEGFSAWIAKWKSWQTRRVELTLDSLQLTPLDSGLQRHHSFNKQLPPTPVYSMYPDNVYGLLPKERVQSIWQTPRHEQWPPLRNMTERSPPSAPESGPNTPDWYGRHGVQGFGQSAATHSTRCMPPLQPLQTLPSSIQSPYYTPYSQQFTPSPWSGHSMGCMCGYCLPYHDHFSMARGYGAQVVAG